MQYKQPQKRMRTMFTKVSLEKMKKIKKNFNSGDILWTADNRNFLSKIDTTSWFHRLYTTIRIFIETIQSYYIYSLSEKFNAKMLEKSELTMEENKQIMNKLKFLKSVCLCPSLLFDVNSIVKGRAY